MKNEPAQTTVKSLTKEIAALIKDEIVATYTEEDNALLMHFLDGRNFRVKVEEVL